MVDDAFERTLSDELAHNMLNALSSDSFIGYAYNPINQNDANTRALFDEYGSVYDIQRRES